MTNTELWDKVCKTDPAATKQFNRGGGFKGTATNATWLAKRATEVFGPMGIGWGIEVVDEEILDGHAISEQDRERIHKVRIKLWYDLDGKKGEVTHFGQTTLVGKNKYGPFTDEEAPKKSLTDAMTKCLSMLGFASDVHLGLFDDNKYVAEMKAEFHPAAETITEEQARDINTLLKDTGSDLDAFLKWVSTGARNNVAAVERIPAKAYDSCIKALERKQRDHP